MNHYSVWKNLLVVAVLAIGIFVALPNLFGKAPSVQVSRDDGQPLEEAAITEVDSMLGTAAIDYADSYIEDGKLLIRFEDVQEQLKASPLLRDTLGKGYVVALTLSSRMPAWIFLSNASRSSGGINWSVKFSTTTDASLISTLRISSHTISTGVS